MKVKSSRYHTAGLHPSLILIFCNVTYVPSSRYFPWILLLPVKITMVPQALLKPDSAGGYFGTAISKTLSLFPIRLWRWYPLSKWNMIMDCEGHICAKRSFSHGKPSYTHAPTSCFLLLIGWGRWYLGVNLSDYGSCTYVVARRRTPKLVAYWWWLVLEIFTKKLGGSLSVLWLEAIFPCVR